MTAFRESSCNELNRICPKLVLISKEMENDEDVSVNKHYNPNHPAVWSLVSTSPHPAGELSKLAIQIILEGVEFAKDLKSLKPKRWKMLGNKCKIVSKVLKTQNRTLLTMFENLELEKYIKERCIL